MWNENGLNNNNRLRLQPLKLELTEAVQKAIADEVNLDANQTVQRVVSALSRNQITTEQALDELVANGIETTVTNNENNVVISSNTPNRIVRIVTNNSNVTGINRETVHNYDSPFVVSQDQYRQISDFIEWKIDKPDIVFVGDHPTIINHDKYENMGAEFDRTVSRKEALEELKKVKDTYVNYYLFYQDCPLQKSVLEGLFDCATYGISSSYINQVKIFDEKNKIPETVNLKEFLSKIITNFKELVESSKTLENTTYTCETTFHKRKGTFTTKQTGNIFDRKNVVNNFNLFLKDNTESSMLGEYIKSIFNSKFDKLGFNETQREAFISIIFREIVIRNNELDMYEICEYNIKPYMLVNAFSKKDSYWLFEFEKFVNQEFARIGKIDNEETANATEIHPNFFGNSTKILRSLNDMTLSSDPGERKFVEILKEAFNKYHCVSFEEKERLVKYILKFINDECGVKYDGAFPSISSECLKKLNEGDAFSIIEKVIHSDRLKMYNEVDFDGVIGDFRQGRIGDCWLLSGIKSLSSNKAGAKLIKNAIRWNADGTGVTVYFAGINQTVELSIDEIYDAMKSGKYSRGDTDVVILELAMQRVYGDINGDNSDAFWKRFIPGGEYHTKSWNGIDDVVTMFGGWLGFDGGKADLSSNAVLDVLGTLLFRGGKSFAATFSLYTSGHSTWSWKTIDGKTGNYESDHSGFGNTGGHEFAITNITPNTVTFVNPHDTSEEYTVTWDVFRNMGIADIYYVIF